MRSGRIIVFILVLTAFTLWPLVLQRSPAGAVLLAVGIVAWIVWSVTAYLRWARALGRAKEANARRDAPTIF